VPPTENIVDFKNYISKYNKFVFSDELESNCWVVEKCACAPKTSYAILVGVTNTISF